MGFVPVPDLETIPYDLVRREADYEIRDVRVNHHRFPKVVLHRCLTYNNLLLLLF